MHGLYNPYDDSLLMAEVGGIRGDAGSQVVNRTITGMLRVSPSGDGTDGLTWDTAYQTIPSALDAASTNVNDCTLILVTPSSAGYDINTTGNPTWSANVILKGTHRNWAKVVNTHESATSILKLTGKSAVCDLNFDLGTSGNGLIMEHGGVRVYSCQFIGINLASAGVGLILSNSNAKHCKVVDCDFRGNVTYMKGLEFSNFGYSLLEDIRIHDCLTGVHIHGANSEENLFFNTDIGDCATAVDIDEGNQQHFYKLILHRNTVNIDDEVGNHIFMDVFGELSVIVAPSNLTGVTVNTGGSGDVWGNDTELRSAALATKPFRVLGLFSVLSSSDKYLVRLSADSGSSYFGAFILEGGVNVAVRTVTPQPQGTEFIFNKGTRISASIKSETGNDNIEAWLELQEI